MAAYSISIHITMKFPSVYCWNLFEMGRGEYVFFCSETLVRNVEEEGPEQ